MYAIQLDFFKSEQEAELDSIRIRLEQVRQSSERVRKGAYARINELTQASIDLRARLEILERNICKGKI